VGDCQRISVAPLNLLVGREPLGVEEGTVLTPQVSQIHVTILRRQLQMAAGHIWRNDPYIGLRRRTQDKGAISERHCSGITVASPILDSELIVVYVLIAHDVSPRCSC